MNIQKFQQYVLEFSREKGFENIPIETRVMFLMSEVGELTDEILKLKTNDNGTKQKDIKRDIGLEMFDVIWNIFDLANKLDISLDAAFIDKININKNREWVK
ncbi:pyrophosphatase [Scopulibacillus cellulosilyticus]|uniref:Pyrophosphatase n=1 Tax=Scopulibacillus cellulosilyticus TaxID=2665665 RepID=A0ABW2PZL0_9BACL